LPGEIRVRNIAFGIIARGVTDAALLSGLGLEKNRMTTDNEIPALAGVLETALYVDTFERACPFYELVLGLNSVYRDQRLCAYDVGHRGVLLLFLRGHSLDTVHMPGGTIPPHDGHGPVHVAFSIAAEDRERWEVRLKESGVAIEGRTKWPRGGESIYFRDPDGHLLELATPGLWPGY
jgi:catechol 2,3-dioxygenase-like lactoylglutathione lyase family enzyme